MKSIAARRCLLLLFGLGPLIILFGYVQFLPAQAYPLEPAQYRTAVAALTGSHVPLVARPAASPTATPGLAAPAAAVRNATAPGQASAAVPTTAAASWPAESTAAGAGLPSLSAFSRQAACGSPAVLCGVYVPGIMALRIVPQPAGDPGYISTESGTATQFREANAFGAIGLLAHNTLSGSTFYSLRLGLPVALVYGDGRVARYQVSEIADFQRLTHADLHSDFMALGNGQTWTANQVFARFYGTPGRLTLQTCIRQGEAADWGVHFVVADPAGP